MENLKQKWNLALQNGLFNLTEEQAIFFVNNVSFREANECWEWQHNWNNDYYGQMRTGPSPMKMGMAHRIIFASLNPEINIRGLVIRHTCDNPPCVNPNHLLHGTHRDNMNDKIQRGRTRLKILSLEEVEEIKERYAMEYITSRESGEDYGVSGRHICYLVKNIRHNGVIT